MFLDVFLDALLDCLKELPFLFAAFLIIEAVEHHISDKMNRALAGADGSGPLVGALLGCVPQCGFSIMAANLYAGGVISLATLMSVFLSTSDEAVIILLAEPGHMKDIGLLVATKVCIGVAAGYLLLLIGKLARGRVPFLRAAHKEPGHICDHCGCHEAHSGILKPALKHTGEVMLFLFIFTLGLNLLLEVIGMENVTRIFLADTVFQPFFAALIGLIPNCAASVILTRLYLAHVISFGSAVAGLCASAGLGLIVLFRINRDRREDVVITVLLLLLSVLAGVLLQQFM